jgi:two-component system, LytTR family, response regulator
MTNASALPAPAAPRYRALIVDDERLARVGLRAMLAEHPEVVCVGEASSGRDAAAAIRDTAPDLVFLDVQMPEQDGFRMLAGLGPHERPAIVFVTAHREYALDAFGVSAVDYLLKPFSRQRLALAVRRAVQFLRGATPGARPTAPHTGRLAARDRDRLVFVDPADVRWFEVYGNYLRLAVGSRYLLLRSTMNAITAQLDPAAFVRISRSVLVNVRDVHSVRHHRNGQYELVMTGGAVLRSSRRYRGEVRKLLAG